MTCLPASSTLMIQTVIEVTFENEREWKLFATVVIRTADGAMHVVKVLVERSTRAGTMSAGQTARLVLQTELLPAWLMTEDLLLEIEQA